MATKLKAQDIDTTETFVLSASQFGNGSVTSPSITFSSDPNTGIYNFGADQLAITTGGVLRWVIDQNGTMYPSTSQGIQFPDGSAAIPSLNFVNQTNTGIYHGAANAINFSSNGTGIAVIGPAGFQMSTGQILAAPGTAAVPGITFTDETSSGFYSLGGNRIGVSIAGSEVWAFTAAGDFGTASTGRILLGDGTLASPALQFNAQANTGIYRAAASDLAISAGGVLVAEFTPTKAIFNQTVLVQDGSVGTPSYGFGNDTGQDTGFYRRLENSVGVTAGGTSVFDFNATVNRSIMPLQVLYSSNSAYALTLNGTSGNTTHYALSMANTATGTNLLADVVCGLGVNDGNQGDPYIVWSIGGPTRYWSMGIDNSNSDVLAVSTTAGGTAKPGTGDIALFTNNGFQMIDGTSSNPSISFINQSSTGIYRPASNAIGFTLGSSAAEWRMSSTGLRPPAIDGGTTFGGFGESRSLNLGTTTDITPDIDASGFIQVRTFNNVNTASSTALYYWWSSATDAGISTIVAPTGSGGPSINSVTIVAPRTIRFNIGAFSGGSAFAFFVKLHNG